MFTVDLSDTGLGGAVVHGYLRFENLPPATSILSATLELVVADVTNADGDSGQLWEATPFDEQTPPTPTTATAPLADSQGRVERGATVSWNVPPTVFGATGLAFFEIRPVTDVNAAGMLYLDHSSTSPPTLQLVVR
jgi:hypothetical protein